MDSLVSKISLLLLKNLSKYQLIKNDRKYSSNHHKTNCGLAHGLCSFITIFEDIFKNFHNIENAIKALKCSVNTILEFAIEDENSLSVLKAGNFLNDEYLIKEAKRIAFKTVERATIVGAARTYTGDAGFCNGASSIASLYKKWYKITGDDQFLYSL
ncbi:hypothetical protein MWU76_12945 [Gelidibacter sp. F2691]|nr:hypothetical protein [Gelidibacter sp. F2691]